LLRSCWTIKAKNVDRMPQIRLEYAQAVAGQYTVSKLERLSTVMAIWAMIADFAGV
jgi:hypothetical protein